MARRPQAEPQRPAARLYLVTPQAADPAALAPALDAMLGAADVAAVLLRLPLGEEPALTAAIKAVAPMAQRTGAALLLDGHPDLVARAGADGAHLTGIEAFTAACGRLKPDRIAGAGGLKTRHDAMLAGERGADYLMFGEPDGGGPPFDALIERVAWWAELFEPPCVGYAASLDEVEALAAAGADFVAVGDLVFDDLGRASAMIAAAAARLAPESVK
jgi:thiamine-phosphate pyrophosphorylase